MTMRTGHIFPRWFIVCPKMFRGSLILRLGLLLLLAGSFLVSYMIFMTPGSTSSLADPSLVHMKLPKEENSIRGSMRKGNWFHDKPSLILREKFDTVGSELYFQAQEEHQAKLNISVKSPKVVQTNEVNSLRVNKQMSTVSNATGRRERKTVPIECDPHAVVSEILRMKPIKFLPEFKNPCWREPIEKPIDELYINNGFFRYSSSYENAFNKVTRRWLEQPNPPTERLRCLPYFFLAGQPKCGSTDFYNRIINHPDIVSPPTKESHWWGKNRYGWCLNYTETIPFSDYADLYDGPAEEIENIVEATDVKGQTFHPVITGDASVSTLWSNDDWWRNTENCGSIEPRYTNAHHVHLLLPKAKIIVILRNPTDRLYSDFLFFQRTGKSPLYFHREVQTAINSLNNCIKQVGVRPCVYNYTVASKSRVRLRLGLYQVYLQEWISLFPRDQLLVVRLEDYSSLPMTTIKKVHRFLDLRMLSNERREKTLEQPMANTRRESDRKLGRMLKETRNILDNFYRPYNIKLAELLEDERFLWDDRAR